MKNFSINRSVKNLRGKNTPLRTKFVLCPLILTTEEFGIKLEDRKYIKNIRRIYLADISIQEYPEYPKTAFESYPIILDVQFVDDLDEDKRYELWEQIDLFDDSYPIYLAKPLHTVFAIGRGKEFLDNLNFFYKDTPQSQYADRLLKRILLLKEDMLLNSWQLYH